MMSRVTSRFFASIGVWVLLLAGCRSAEVVNHCLQADGNCPPCSFNSECGFTGNPCAKNVVCVHRDVPIASVDIGCDEAIEYSWPDPEECACVSSVCQYTDE
jgi:hypothetical protein